jgi:hypothetical protein
MNADGNEDLLVLHDDGYLDLMLNMRGKFRMREQIAYVPDIVSRGLYLGDFQTDGYADILGVNGSGSFVYIDNDARRFARRDIDIGGAPVPTGISQFRIRDMDSDSRDDIVYLTE